MYVQFQKRALGKFLKNNRKVTIDNKNVNEIYTNCEVNIDDENKS